VQRKQRYKDLCLLFLKVCLMKIEQFLHLFGMLVLPSMSLLLMKVYNTKKKS
jgi:hypothetical protein